MRDLWLSNLADRKCSVDDSRLPQPFRSIARGFSFVECRVISRLSYFVPGAS